MKPYGLYINGEFVTPQTSATLDVIDPSTAEVIARTPDAGAADVDRAVKAARAAFDSGPWKDVTAQDRGRMLFKIAAIVRDRADELAELGKRGVEEYLNVKQVYINLSEAPIGGTSVRASEQPRKHESPRNTRRRCFKVFFVRLRGSSCFRGCSNAAKRRSNDLLRWKRTGGGIPHSAQEHDPDR